MPKYVYDFAEGGKDLKGLLGGKGANLAEMANLGLPVPPGFTIITEVCRAYLADGREPPGLRGEVSAHLAGLEARVGRVLGHPGDPVSVRYFHRAGLDYVSCSPFQVPIAWLEAGRAAGRDVDSDTR